MTAVRARAIRQIKRNRNRLILFAASVLVALVLCEIIVRVGDLDWRLIHHLLSYQKADRGSHEMVPDPNLFFRLKPGTTAYPMYTVHINKLRFRGPERTAVKPDGVFRIIVFGGSNVYGLGLEDHQTWPAQLERALNEKDDPRTFEVWNGGACAYVPSQMVVVAKEAVINYDPDLTVFALSNSGPPSFMDEDEPTYPYFFEVKPSLWQDLFRPDCTWPGIGPYRMKLWAIKHIRLYRLIVAGLTAQDKKCTWLENPNDSSKEMTREFLTWAKNKAGVLVFLYPGCLSHMHDYRPFYEGLDVPLMELSAKGLADEFADIHPSPQVTKWYGEEMADWLSQSGLLD